MTQFTGKVTGGHILYVPPAHAIHGNAPVGICTVVVNGDGEICAHPSYSESERRHHAADCATKHASAIHAYRKRSHPEIMNAWDPELEAFVQRRKHDILSGREPMPQG